MAKYQTLKDDEIVRIARATVTETTAGTYTQKTMDTQLSIERGIIWMIHSFEFWVHPLILEEIAAGSPEFLSVQVTRESKAALLDFNDSDLLAKYQVSVQRSDAIGTDAGPLWIKLESPQIFRQKPAIPYASQNMFFAVDGTLLAPQTAYLRVLYTIRTVSDKYFFRVAQALLG